MDTAEDMRKGAEAFSAMDPSETPGTRASVDMCELKLDRRATGIDGGCPAASPAGASVAGAVATAGASYGVPSSRSS